ncbi:MAG: hypothetical protein AB7N65_23925 [Vicinamibacterales bacterium]
MARTLRWKTAERITVDDLIARADEQQARRDRLHSLLERRRNVTAEAEREVAALLADTSPSARAYALLGKERHRADIRQIAAERARVIAPHIARALFEAEHHQSRLAQSLADFEAVERQAPSLEDVVLDLSGQVGWSIDSMLIGALLEQTVIRNTLDAMRSAPPSERLEMYVDASASPHDPVSAVIIATMERHRIPYPDGGALPAEEVTAAAELGRLMTEAQAARVPDVSRVREVLADVSRTIHLAKVAGVLPQNPLHPGPAAEPLPDPLPAPAATEG